MRQRSLLAFSVVLMAIALVLAIAGDLPVVISSLMGACLAIQLVYLLVNILRGFRKYARVKKKDKLYDDQQLVERLVAMLASSDRREARRAARLLGQMSFRDGTNYLGPFPVEDIGFTWQRWNAWWLLNRDTSELETDKS